MIKKLMNYFFILALTSGSFTFSIEKEVQSKKEVASLTELAARKNALILWDLFQKDPAQFLTKLNMFAQQLPKEALLPILNFNLQELNNEAQKTFLLEALVRKFPVQIIERLIELGADVNKDNDYGWAALHFAISLTPEENISLIQKIIDAKADVNKISLKNKRTPIFLTIPMQMSFIENYKKEFLKLLIKNEAKLNIVDSTGRTILDYADSTYERGKGQSDLIMKIKEMIKILEEGGAKRGKDLKK